MNNREISFDRNIRYYREKMNLTQRELANMIGFTEKSVSKWETSKSLPTIETVLSLANIFKISVDELVYGKQSARYYLGIDGGGTKTAFLLTDDNDNIIKKAIKSSSNPNDVGMETAQAVLKEGIDEVCAGIPKKKIYAFAGIAGGNSGNNPVPLREFFSQFGFGSIGFGSDIQSVMALAEGEDKIIIIMGTGFVLYANKDGQSRRVGGWGQRFDEGGSGYNLGKDAIYAALKEFDGSGEATVMSEMIESRIGEATAKHLSKFYQGGKNYIASFSDVVFKAMEEGDAVAKSIFEKNMLCVAEAINTADRLMQFDAGTCISFAGGISNSADVIFPVISKHINNDKFILKHIACEPVYGAIKLAKGESETYA